MIMHAKVYKLKFELKNVRRAVFSVWLFLSDFYDRRLKPMNLSAEFQGDFCGQSEWFSASQSEKDNEFLQRTELVLSKNCQQIEIESNQFY